MIKKKIKDLTEEEREYVCWENAMPDMSCEKTCPLAGIICACERNESVTEETEVEVSE